MHPDEKAIRDLVENWQRETKAGNLNAILDMMTEDVVFMLAGRPPMRGRDAFAETFRAGMQTQKFRIDSSAEIEELQLLSDTAAFCRTRLAVNMIPLNGGEPIQREGYTMTIFRKCPDGPWRLSRDANMLSAKNPTR